VRESWGKKRDIASTEKKKCEAAICAEIKGLGGVGGFAGGAISGERGEREIANDKREDKGR